jgi:hypothetical protein
MALTKSKKLTALKSQVCMLHGDIEPCSAFSNDRHLVTTAAAPVALIQGQLGRCPRRQRIMGAKA